MDWLVQLFTAANTLTPLAIIGLLIGVLYVQLWKQPNKTEVAAITDNHLSDLPAIRESTSAMAQSLQRIEISQARIEAKIDSLT